MSIVYIPDDLEIQIINNNTLDEAYTILTELMCLNDIGEDEGAIAIKEQQINQLITLIAIYERRYIIPTCEHLNIFQ